MTYDEHLALLKTAIKIGGLDETLEMVAGVLAQRDEEADKLRDLLRDADKVVMWELTPARRGFQEEIEAALGIQ
jgi:hypothetical protein